MRAVRLLEDAISKGPETVLDVAVGTGKHAQAFISTGSHVTGIDLTEAPCEHPNYTHLHNSFEVAVHNDLFETAPFDMIWSCHTLEHMPNVQAFLTGLHKLLKDDGWLYIAVPPFEMDRMHIGHLTYWTPAILIYNLICAGWDCRDAMWYTEYCSIGLCVQNKPEIDLSWRTGMPGECVELNQYTPRSMLPEHGAWWSNNWHEETDQRAADPPGVTAGLQHTNLPPKVQLAFGPNPALRKEPGCLNKTS